MTLKPFIARAVLVAAVALAGPSVATAAERTDATRAIALQAFQPEPGNIELRSSAANAEIFVALAERARVRSASMLLHFENSISLLSDRSQLAVRLNGGVVGQIPLNPDQPTAVADITLPADRFERGFNSFTFEAAQHAVNGCEDTGAPELWTTVDTQRSELRLDFDFAPIEPTLADLDDLMSPAIGGARHLNVLTPAADATAGASGLDENELRWGGLVAQALALRLQFIAPTFSHQTAEAASLPMRLVAKQTGWRFPAWDQSGLIGEDHVLIGTRDDLAPYLGAEAEQITDAYLGIFPLDADPSRFVVVVSGLTDDEVTRAATALSVMELPFTDAPRALIRELDLPANVFTSSRVNARADGRYSFADLGVNSSTFRGRGPHQLDVSLVLPPDLYAREEDEVAFALNFAYGAGMRGDSVLNLYINGLFERAIHLDQVTGLAFRDYRLDVPLRSLDAGANTLSLEAVLVPLITGDCTLNQENNLLLSVFDDSDLSIPRVPHAAQQPDLDLMSRTGFPYNGAESDDQPTVVQFAATDSETAAAGWTVIAKLAQSAGRALAPLNVALDSRAVDGHLIVVGAVTDIDPVVRRAAPLPLGEVNDVPHRRVAIRGGSEPPAPSIFAGLLEVVGVIVEAENEPAFDVRRVVQTHDLGEIGVIMAFERPRFPGRTLTMITAKDTAQLSTRVAALVTPSYWTQLGGDLSFWNDDPRALGRQTVGDTFLIGDLDPIDSLGLFAASRPALWVSIMAALLILFTLVTWRLANRLTRRRLDG